MAGDWIKMRAALIDNPKVIAMTRWLQKHRPFREWMTPGGSGPANDQIVSDLALRCVTTSLLMRTWSIAREHGRFEGDDLVLAHSEIHDLDQMAGAPGIGAAMQMVEWAKDENGVTLPNFTEFNVPMSPAEKQKAYRERRAGGNGQVTLPLPGQGNAEGLNVTPREEKRREEEKSSAGAPGIPAWVDAKAWADFVAHRKAKRSTMTPRAMELVIAKLQDYRAKGVSAADVLNYAIENGHLGLYYKPERSQVSQFAPASRAGQLAAEDFD